MLLFQPPFYIISAENYENNCLEYDIYIAKQSKIKRQGILCKSNFWDQLMNPTTHQVLMACV